MTFDDILDQVIALLKRQGRVSYRALKMRFEEIDDEYLDVLKEELFFAYPVTDESDKGFVWNGETETTTESPSQPNQPKPQPVIEPAQPDHVETPSVEAPVSDAAERRQLTVMFCDLVDSTSLSGELDPEDLRDVVREYQSACTEVVQRYEGHVAQLLGDGLLVYFGFPLAHEDDAQRAVHTGLGIIAAIENLNIRLEQDQGIKLAVRLGIHTGLVVVGEMGGEGRQEQLALGETPNVSARIQGLAEPDTLMISDATHRLVQGFFDCDSLGEHALKGVTEPVPVYRVLNPSGAQHRLDVSSPIGLTPLIGRASECTLLSERWEQAKNGNGQVILLSGEAGIGKSRLVQMLKEHVSEGPHIRLECRSSPYFTNSALYPIIDMVQRTLRFQADDTPETKLDKLEESLCQYRLPLEETVPLFGDLLSLPVPEDRYPPLNATPQRQRQKTLESIVSITLELSERQPVLFILEDAHWLDASTLELIELLIDQVPTSSISVLITYRPEFQPTWGNRSYLTQVTLNRLSQNQIKSIVTQVADGKTLPDELIEQLVDKTDGVPLYCEEMTKAVLESGVLKEANDQYEWSDSISSLSIPSTLQDSLMSRLDRLVTAKVVAQYASVIGRQFSYELLQAVSELDKGTLQRELSRLVDAELVYQRGLPPHSTYLFKHALVVDTAYASLLKRTRQNYHQRIAQVLEERFPETTETQPELVAHHYTEAGLNEQAVNYWQRAGEQAIHRSSNPEAIAHLNRGLEILKMMPDTSEHIYQALRLQTALGSPLMAIKGYRAHEVKQNYSRALELSEKVKDSHQLFPILAGLRRHYTVTNDFEAAQKIGERLTSLARQADNPMLMVEACFALGVNAFWAGDFVLAQSHFAKGIEVHVTEPDEVHTSLYGLDPRMACLIYDALNTWTLGFPDRALEQSQDALASAQALGHPHTLAFITHWAIVVRVLRREVDAVQRQIELLVAISEEHGFGNWLSHSTSLRNWALAIQGQPRGAEQMYQNLMIKSDTGGGGVTLTYLFALLAEAYDAVGQSEKSLRIIAKAHELLAYNQRNFYGAEIYRLNGELLLHQSINNASEAEQWLSKSLNMARHQKMKSFELRTATSLARLWQNQGKRDEARELLEPLYSWFTEGHDTADLIDAKALLDELTEGS